MAKQQHDAHVATWVAYLESLSLVELAMHMMDVEDIRRAARRKARR
jgi:energy-converting hydrogenase Eha subunit C